MKTILLLLLQDLRRDARHPWWMLLLAGMPLLLALLVGGVFAGSSGKGPAPTLHLAVLDQDEGLLGRMLRGMPAERDTARRLDLRFVSSREEGLRLVERRKASALIVLPRDLTDSLLEGRTNTLELYENPAEQILPRVARQGALVLALGLSSAAETLGEPLRDLRALARSGEFPGADAIGEVAQSVISKLRNLRSYAFPPLVRFETIAAEDYQPVSTSTPP